MPEDLFMDEGSNLIPSILQNLVFETNILTRLQAIDTLLSALDEKDLDMKIKIKEFKQKLKQEYLLPDKNKDDPRKNFMRRLKLYSKINENVETAIEYHSEDFITHPEYIFDADFERKITDLNLKINTLVGELLKEYSRGEEIEL